jgi:hypothetical protein
MYVCNCLLEHVSRCVVALLLAGGQLLAIAMNSCVVDVKRHTDSYSVLLLCLPCPGVFDQVLLLSGGNHISQGRWL